jgi:hypothetical protein
MTRRPKNDETSLASRGFMFVGGPSAPRAPASPAPPPRKAGEYARRPRPSTCLPRTSTVSTSMFAYSLTAVRVGGFRGDARSPPAGRDANPHWFRSAQGAHKPKDPRRATRLNNGAHKPKDPRRATRLNNGAHKLKTRDAQPVQNSTGRLFAAPFPVAELPWRHGGGDSPAAPRFGCRIFRTCFETFPNASCLPQLAD